MSNANHLPSTYWTVFSLTEHWQWISWEMSFDQQPLTDHSAQVTDYKCHCGNNNNKLWFSNKLLEVADHCTTARQLISGWSLSNCLAVSELSAKYVWLVTDRRHVGNLSAKCVIVGDSSAICRRSLCDCLLCYWSLTGQIWPLNGLLLQFTVNGIPVCASRIKV